MGGISFMGNPPYTLPAVQRVEAKAVDAAVEITLRVIVPDLRPDYLTEQSRLPFTFMCIYLWPRLNIYSANFKRLSRSQKRKRGRKVTHCGSLALVRGHLNGIFRASLFQLPTRHLWP